MSKYDLINEVNSRGTFACTHAVLPYMLKQNSGRIINMSPPVDLRMLKGKVAYSISKFGMTLQVHGLAQEVENTGIGIYALWPATLIESFATMNFKMGNEAMWRKATILSDCCISLVTTKDKKLSGEALIDEDYLKTIGMKDFKCYRKDPNVEPPRITIATEMERGKIPSKY
jgi:citronellol/citronellal dehydrogenase